MKIVINFSQHYLHYVQWHTIRLFENFGAVYILQIERKRLFSFDSDAKTAWS